MSTRGVLYIVWDGSEKRVADALEKSIASIKAVHPELPYTVHRLPASSTLLDKAAMLDITPYDETLFLDADTVVLDRVDYAFDKAVKHGLACCICECPWARRYTCCDGEDIEYNCGILWFTKAAKPVFDKWQELNKVIDSSIIFRTTNGLRRMGLNDQAGFTLAIEQTGLNPWILPLNYNFRPIWHHTWFGPIKIWHDYSEVNDELRELNQSQIESGRVVDFIKAAE